MHKARVQFALDLYHADVLDKSVWETFEYDNLGELDATLRQRSKELGLPYITVYPPGRTLDKLEATAMSDGYNEQETIFYQEQKIASLMAPILDRIGVPDLPWWKPHADGRSADLPHRWDWNHAHDEKHKSYIVISDIFYNDGDSKVLHTETSKPKVIKGQEWSRLFITGDQPFDDTVTVSMDLQTTKSSSYSADVSFSITNRAKVAVKDGGVEASDEVDTTTSSSFGLNNSSAQTKTEHWSESTAVHVGTNKNVRLVADKESYTEIRTIQETAYLDFKFKIHLHRGSCGDIHRYLCDGESYQPFALRQPAGLHRLRERAAPARAPEHGGLL